MKINYNNRTGCIRINKKKNKNNNNKTNYLVNKLKNDKNLSKFYSLLKQYYLLDKLKNITLLAPNNNAIDFISDILKNLSKDQIKNILLGHFIDKVYYSHNLKNGMSVMTYSNMKLTVRKIDNTLTQFVAPQSAATVLQSCSTSNGQMYIINNVLLPNINITPESASSRASAPVPDRTPAPAPARAPAPAPAPARAPAPAPAPARAPAPAPARAPAPAPAPASTKKTDPLPAPAPAATKKTDPLPAPAPAPDLDPGKKLNIVTIASETSTLTKLVELLEAYDLVPTIQNAERLTVLAPTNDAFNEILDILGTLEADVIKDILLSHVIDGAVFSKDLVDGMIIETFGSLTFEVKIKDGQVYFMAEGADGLVITADIEASNGVVHVIDTVLIPQVVFEEVTAESVINVASTPLGNRYVFNGESDHKKHKHYCLKKGKYMLKNIPVQHPLAILNHDKKSKIKYKVNPSTIIIKISGGSFSNPFFTFKIDNEVIDINNYMFMDGITYTFVNEGISSFHTFVIRQNNNTIQVVDEVSIMLDGIIEYFGYECGIHTANMNKQFKLNKKLVKEEGIEATYNFYYGDVEVEVMDDFGEVSVYCYNHGYMGGKHLLIACPDIAN